MSGDVPTEARIALRCFLHDILHDVAIITEHSRRQTATVMDVLLALKRRGRCATNTTCEAVIYTQPHNRALAAYHAGRLHANRVLYISDNERYFDK